MLDLNLDVDSPEKILPILRRAIDAFNSSAEELTAAWQDASAGRPWGIIARELERAADTIERKLSR